MLVVTDQTSIKNRAGEIARTLDQVLLRAQQYKTFLDQFTDQNLIDNWGFVQADINTLRSAVSDMDQLRTIYQGTANLSVAKDFRTFAKQTYPFGSI